MQLRNSFFFVKSAFVPIGLELDAIAAKQTPGDGDRITIKLTVEPKPYTGTAEQIEIKNEAGNGKNVEFLDMSLWRLVNDGTPDDGKIEKTGHDWTYSASGNVITATCRNNAAHTATLTLTAASPTYTNIAVEASFEDTSAWTSFGLELPTITYTAKTGSSLTDGKAANAGSYTAKASVTVGGQTYTATQDFEISKATLPAGLAVSVTGWTYGENDNTPSVTDNVGNGAVSYTYKVKGADDSTYTKTKPVDAGSYTVRASIAETTNYEAATVEADFTIDKVDMVVGTNLLAPSVPVSGLVYDGSAKELLCAGQTWDEKDGAPFGTFYYSVDGESWSTDLPTAISAGEYNPVWYFVGDKNHNNIGSAEAPISQLYPIEISRGDQTAATVVMDGYTYGGTLPPPSISITPSENATVTYYYSATNTTTGGTEWKDMTATTLNAGTYYLYAVIAATDNYSSQTTAAVAFTVAKADQTASFAGEGYSLDENLFIIISDGYEVSATSGDFASIIENGTQLTDGTTYYIRKVGDANHNPSPETAFIAHIVRCTYTDTIRLVENGTYGMKLNCCDKGEFTFVQVEGGWSIQNADGKYLTMKDGKLVLNDEAFAWTYKNGSFSASVKTEQKSGGYWWGWIYIPGCGSKTVTTTYYLSTVTDGANLSTCCVCAELYTTVSGDHDFGCWIDCKDGANHKRQCKHCGEWETEAHDYDETTHKCVCGAYNPSCAVMDVTATYATKTQKQFSGFLFWGTWKNVTTYTATVKVNAEGMKVTKVEVAASENGYWTKGNTFTSNSEIEQFFVRVTTSDGEKHLFRVADGIGHPAN
ncbi:MAG: hypothetical protein Q3995_07760 [Eubacteriales bacterium]|nr:hypothetical protein [Eubacteriales bacterium]